MQPRRMIFLSLPGAGPARTARAFYEALGFRINEYSSDERTASVVVDENIVVTLQTREPVRRAGRRRGR